MDIMLNSKKEKDSIYEIYRACRLCGGGAGYKMPIIQNIIDLEADVELKQKIRDCVQIEVHQDDKMPPLICELCVDKVNDFYEFLEMCRQTNIRTRLKLGLPPQSLARGTADAGDCILGLTEPVFVNKSLDGKAQTKTKKVSKVKVKKESAVKIKTEIVEEERSSRHRKREPTPPRLTRNRAQSKEDDLPLTSFKDDKSKPLKSALKPILKKENSNKNPEKSIQNHHAKRSFDIEPSNSEAPAKKVKILIKPLQSLKTTSSPKISLRSMPNRPTRSHTSSPVKRPSSPPVKAPSPPKETFDCIVCRQSFKSPRAKANHMRIHTVNFTNPKLACNPCGEWFPTSEETASHHKTHMSRSMPYSCGRCYSDFKQLSGYEEHFRNNECIPYKEIPDVKCESCWHTFATNNLLFSHRCLGEDYRPGGNCSKCNKSYSLLKNLKKHETACRIKKSGKLNIKKEWADKVKPVQIRVARCDPLLINVKQEHYDVSTVSYDYGLDHNCYYPYISQLGLKSIFPGMVDIHDDIKKVFCSEDYVHWDSDDSESDNEIEISNEESFGAKKRKVDSLVVLTLKTIFSQRLIGKVPKKKRKVKIEKAFDSLLVDDDDVKIDINNIINNLGDDDDDQDKSDHRTINQDVSVECNDKNDTFGNVNGNVSNDLSKEDNCVNSNDKENISNDNLKDSLNKDANDSLKRENNDENCAKSLYTVNNENNLLEINDSALEQESCDDGDLSKTLDLNINDSQDSVLENEPSVTDSKIKNNDSDSNNALVINKDGKELDKSKDIVNNDEMYDTNGSNDKIVLDDVLHRNAQIKTDLGLNEISFDTL